MPIVIDLTPMVAWFVRLVRRVGSDRGFDFFVLAPFDSGVERAGFVFRYFGGRLAMLVLSLVLCRNGGFVGIDDAISFVVCRN